MWLVTNACGVFFQFQPQLVLVAAGFDSVIGDPKVRKISSGVVISLPSGKEFFFIRFRIWTYASENLKLCPSPTKPQNCALNIRGV